MNGVSGVGFVVAFASASASANGSAAVCEVVNDITFDDGAGATMLVWYSRQ